MTESRNASMPLGLIGGGPWGRNYIHTIGALEDAELVALASQQEENRELATPGCRFSTDWRELIGDPSIRGLIIATPPPLHFEMAAAALQAGQAVLVEKPLTLRLDEAERLAALERSTGLPVLVDHILLFHPGFEALCRERARLGRIRHVRCVGGAPGPCRPDTPGFEDYAPHSLAQVLELLGESPAKVQARLRGRRRLPQGIGETVEVTLQFPSGVAAEILTGNGFEQKDRRLEVTGSEGKAVFSDMATEPLRWDEGSGFRAVSVPAEAPLGRVVGCFVAALRGRRSPRLGFRTGLEIVRLMVECRRQLDAEAVAV